MKVFVGTPIPNKKLHAAYANSMMYAAFDCASRDIKIELKIINNSCFIELARSTLVYHFLKSDCTHLFFIDSDIGFERHALAGLVQAGVPFCAGVYRKREPKLLYNVRLHEPQEFHGPWIRADRVATGFMCIERHVLEEMSKRAPECLMREGDMPMVFRTETKKKFTGEDYCFCDDYNKLYEEGVFDQPIWVYPDITFDHDGYLGNLHESLMEEDEI